MEKAKTKNFLKFAVKWIMFNKKGLIVMSKNYEEIDEFLTKFNKTHQAKNVTITVGSSQAIKPGKSAKSNWHIVMEGVVEKPKKTKTKAKK